jgi:eukaryotic-like serine/threonine-protein kinase
MKKPILFGKYLLLERINVGGMAEVFIAKHFGVEGFEKILAIKKILPTMAEDEEFIAMFGDEARISVQLNHANIAHILDFGKSDENYFISMEYVAGRDLRAILERQRRRKEILPTGQAVFIASKMCEGLDYAHRKKDPRGNELHIIHRDISPQNVLVSYEGEVKLIDFGIAKATNRSQKTQAGTLKGKFGYMSPEQVRGFEIDRRSDVFAVGVLLYEMLTGEKLFLGESDFSTLEKVRNAEVPMPTTFNPNIPAGLEKVVLKALAREPEDRHQWASDLHEDLMRYLVAGDQVYSSKHLAGFMKAAFAEDLLREQERMERFAAIHRPEQMETSGVSALPIRPSARRKSSDAETPAGGARPAPAPNASRGPLPILLSTPSSGQAAGPNASALPPAAVERTHVFEDTNSRRGFAASSAGLAGPSPQKKGGMSGGEPQESPPHPARTRSEGVTRVDSEQPDAQAGRTLPDGNDADSTLSDAPADRAENRSGWQVKKIALVAGVAVAAALAAMAVVVLSGGDPGAARVVVKVDPMEGAQISIDGSPASSGQPLTLPPGHHEIEASAPGRKAAKRVVTLEAGENAPIAFELLAMTPTPEEPPGAPATFTARFVSKVPEVEIALGDRIIGLTPNAVAADLEVGKSYRFAARKAGFKPYEGEFTAGSAGELEVAVELVEELKRPPAALTAPERKRPASAQAKRKGATGGLACSTRPAGAEVLVDGKPTGRMTPVALGNPVMVPVGNRVIQFRMEGKKSAARMVEIKEGEVARLVNVPLE